MNERCKIKQTGFDLCVPRTEVLKGELREDIFAARLKDVMDDNAEPVYSDPNVFFDNTYPTSGLKTLLKDATSRLSVDDYTLEDVETITGVLYQHVYGKYPSVAESVYSSTY